MCNTPAVLMAFCSRTCKKLLCYIALLLPLSPFMASRSIALPLDKNTSPAELIPPSAASHDKIDWLLDVAVVEERNLAIYLSTSGPSYQESSKRFHISARQFSNNLPLESFGSNGEVTHEPFSYVESARGIVNGDNLYIAVLGTLKGSSEKPKLHILKLNLLTGKIANSFAGSASQSLPDAEYSYFPDKLYIHNDRLLVAVNYYSGAGHIHAYNLETGLPDPRFANGGQLSISADKVKGYISKILMEGDSLFIGASFADINTSPEKYSNQNAICRVNLINGQIEAPFDCTNEASWLTSHYGHNNRIRAMALTDNGALVMGVDENTSKVPYMKSAAALYSFDSKTGAPTPSFGTSGRIELTQPHERHMLRSVTPSGDHLLVNIERLSLNKSGKLESPFSASKESAIYALHARTGELDLSFGDKGRLSLTGDGLQELTTRYAVLQPEQKRLLVVLDESIDNREISKECTNALKFVHEMAKELSPKLTSLLSGSYHVEFEDNLSLNAKLIDEYKVFDPKLLKLANTVPQWLYDYAIKLCPLPEITRHLSVFAIDLETGTLNQTFGNAFGEAIISPNPGESLVARKAHIASNGQIILFNQLFQDKHNRLSSDSVVLSADGLRSQYPLYPLIKKLPAQGSHASKHILDSKATFFAIVMGFLQLLRL